MLDKSDRPTMNPGWTQLGDSSQPFDPSQEEPSRPKEEVEASPTADKVASVLEKLRAEGGAVTPSTLRLKRG